MKKSKKLVLPSVEETFAFIFFVKPHYSNDSFFKESMCYQYLLYISSVCGAECLGEIYEQ